MRCKLDDVAWITKSMVPSNLMKMVKVIEYIGRFEKDDRFEYRGSLYSAPASDHLWWIESTSINTVMGETTRAYIPDSWLRPIPPDTLDDDHPIEEKLNFGADVLTKA